MLAHPFLDQRQRQVPHIQLRRETAADPFGEQHGLLQQQEFRLGLHVETLGDLKQLRQQPGDGDLTGGAIENRLADRPERLVKHHAVCTGRDVIRLEMHIRDALVVAGDKAEQHVRQEITRAPVDPSHDPEIDDAQGSVGAHKCVSGVHVGVEEPISKDLQEKGFRCLAHDCLKIMARRDKFIEIMHRDSGNPLGGQDAAPGPLPIDCRDDIHRVVFEVAMQFRCGRAFHAQIHLPAQAFGEGLDRNHRPQAPQPRLGGLGDVGDPAEQVQVALHSAFDARPQDLDRDITRFRLGGRIVRLVRPVGLVRRLGHSNPGEMNLGD